jgi:hypothetical protein
VRAPQASDEASPKPAELSAEASVASTESGQQDVGPLPQAETPLRQECGASSARRVLARQTAKTGGRLLCAAAVRVWTCISSNSWWITT